MYQNIYVNRKDETIHIWDDIKGYLCLPLSTYKYAYKRQVGGKHKSIYGDELTKVSNFNDADLNLFESDVPIETRVLLDMYPESDEPSKGHKIGVIDIETDTKNGFANIETADKAITSIALFDYVTEKYTVFLLDKKGTVSSREENNTTIKVYDDEDQLLMSFLDKWQELGFTIITGWNVDYFDMPYLYIRIKNCLGAKCAKHLSPVGSAYLNGFTKKLTIGGISVLDYILLYKKFSLRMEPTYALGPIGKKIVGIDKIKYDGSLDDLYESDINKFIEYNLTDVKIVVALDKKLQFIDLARRICHVGHVPYEAFHMSSRYLDGAILLFLKRNGGRIAPNKPSEGREEYEERMEEGTEGFSGAFVKEPVPGRYNWVFDLDLTSMYPNIIISLNISPETKAGKVNKVEMPDEGIEIRTKNLKIEYELLKEKPEPLEDYIENRLNRFDMDVHVRGKINSYILGSTTYSADDFKKLVDESKYSLTSNGIFYRTDKKGVIPEILSAWFQERTDMRKKAKECKSSGDEEGYFFNNQRQQVWKILLNSMYGVLGLPIFRFYDVDNAEAVTTCGVSIIKTTGKAINTYYAQQLGVKDGDWVIYTDTDSCFVDAIPIIKHRFPDLDFNNDNAMTTAIMSVTTEVQLYVNKFYNVMAKRFFNLDNHAFDAKQEVISKTSFWLAKKRYAQWIIHKEGSLLKEPELEIKGIDVVRTSFPLSFRKFMELFLRNLLQGIPQSKLDDDILEFKSNIKNLDVVEIAKNTSVRYVSQDGKHNYNPEDRKPFQVLKGTPAQVRACISYNDLLHKWGLSQQYDIIHHAQKIKWIYLKDNEFDLESLALKGDGTDPQKILDFITKYVDRNKMFDKELKSKLIDFYNVLRWEFPNESTKIAAQFFDF